MHPPPPPPVSFAPIAPCCRCAFRRVGQVLCLRRRFPARYGGFSFMRSPTFLRSPASKCFASCNRNVFSLFKERVILFWVFPFAFSDAFHHSFTCWRLCLCCQSQFQLVCKLQAFNKSCPPAGFFLNHINPPIRSRECYRCPTDCPLYAFSPHSDMH